MTHLLNAIAELAEELCDARQYREPIYEWTPSRNRKLVRTVVTTQAGLISQLRESIQPASGTTDSARPVPASRPPLQIEALDRLIAIEKAAHNWTWLLRLQPRLYIEATVRHLVDGASQADDDTRHALAVDMRRWRGWAAVMTGWASPPMTPYVRCPNSDCSQLATLRILPERRAALCSHCGHVWDDTDGTFAALGIWIVAQADVAPPRLRLHSSVAGHGGWANRDGNHITVMAG